MANGESTVYNTFMNATSESPLPPYALFHRIADEDCVLVRSRLRDTFLRDLVRFRNVDTGPEALADLTRLTNDTKVPVLKVNEGLVLIGKIQILSWIEDQLQKQPA